MINWEESIKEIIQDTFPVSFEFVEDSFFQVVYSNETEINIFMRDNRKRLIDVVYWNEKGAASIDDFGMYFENGDYSRRNVKLLREILEVPLKRGWTEVNTKVRGNTVKLEVFYGLGEDMDKTSYHSSSKQYYGCLSILTFPFHFLLKHVSGSFRRTEIEKKEIPPVLY